MTKFLKKIALGQITVHLFQRRQDKMAELLIQSCFENFRLNLIYTESMAGVTKQVLVSVNMAWEGQQENREQRLYWNLALPDVPVIWT